MSSRLPFAVILAVLLCLTVPTLSQAVKATTENGKQILVFPDGTWRALGDTEEPAEMLDSDPAFRGLPWGTSQTDAKKSEGKLAEEEAGGLVYGDTIDGLETEISFKFVNDKLVSGNYVFTVNHTNWNDYILDFDKVSEGLTEKYGKPGSENVVWRDGIFQDDNTQWGMRGARLVLALALQLPDPPGQQVQGLDRCQAVGLLFTQLIQDFDLRARRGIGRGPEQGRLCDAAPGAALAGPSG